MAALLPDVNNGSSHQDHGTLDSFGMSGNHGDDSDTEGDTSAQDDDEHLARLVVRDTINSLPLSHHQSTISGLALSDPETSPSDDVGGTKYRLSGFRSPKSDSIGTKQRSGDETAVEGKRRSKGSSSKENAPEDPVVDASMPELESYVAMDCNVSNVSPDSGIQSVNGSPLHHVGSPAQHHSPFYGSSSSSICSSNSGGGRILGDNCLSNNNSSRPYSPSLASQNSPPPPTLLPAITPPHLHSESPQYNYDESPNSPPMPSLKCQVDLPFWRPEGGAKQTILEEQGTFKVRGPGRPRLDKSKPKRSRGRPKGSKNKKTLALETLKFQENSETANDQSIVKNSDDSKYFNRENNFSDGFKYPSSHNWRDGSNGADNEDVPPPPSEPIPSLKRGPGRPKKVVPPPEVNTNSNAPESSQVQTQNNNTASDSSCYLKSANSDNPYHSRSKYDENSNDFIKKKHKKALKVKKSVGRPRKYAKPGISSTVPATAASKKCFSERIMHKIVNEKVRNSEKSDKLSVHSQVSSNSDKELPDPYSFQEQSTGNLAQPYLWEKRKKNKGKGVRLSSDGIPLDERRRRRGRKMELPAIFQKVYGPLDKKNRTRVEPFKPNESQPQALAATNKQNHKKKKKKMKQFKTKHKNIVDPVFLTELENLLSLLQQCSIAKVPNPVQPKSGEALLPSIFRIRKISPIAKKRRGSEKPKTSDRESGTEGEGSKDRSAGKRKKKMQEVPKQVFFVFFYLN